MISTIPTKTALIERFSLHGVHGYKDITIECPHAIAIIAAENGTGKTTLLAALNAFISGRLHRLSSVSFERLECKLSNLLEPIILHRRDISAIPKDAELHYQQVAEKVKLNYDDLADFVINKYSPSKFYSELETHPVINQIYINTPGSREETKKLVDSLYHAHESALSGHAREMAALLRRAMHDADILYLPTYRRIEKPILRKRRKKTDPWMYYNVDENKDSAKYEGISFGLGDIEDRLAEISDEIEKISNYGYRQQSAKILQDMLKGRQNLEQVTSSGLPDIESLSRFLGRVDKSENNLQSLFQNIETLYNTGDIQSSDYEILRYFLVKLNSVITQTKSLEQRIERFVEVCNSYLTMSSDEKKLSYDPQTLKVEVKDVWANRVIPFDALSSGEKQIVSMLAKLYLDKEPKIVLIDEPELSLSIEWQKKVLPDLLNSNSVLQLIAITHSPFIFENELDQFATGLKIHKFIGTNV